MTKEEIIQYFKDGDFSEMSREEVLYQLFQSGEVQVSDYLELREAIQTMMRPVLVINNDVPWDEDAWLESQKCGQLIYSPSDDDMPVVIDCDGKINRMADTKRDLADMLLGETIIFDNTGKRVSVEDLPDDCKIVEEKKISFEEIKKAFMETESTNN